MDDTLYAATLERHLDAARAELAAVRADLERAVRDRAVLLEACEWADVVMDTAAMHGIGDILPDTYRGTWA